MDISESEMFAMRVRLAQMERDLRTLANEVRAWRTFWYEIEDENKILHKRLVIAQAATDEENVLARVSE